MTSGTTPAPTSGAGDLLLSQPAGRHAARQSAGSGSRPTAANASEAAEFGALLVGPARHGNKPMPTRTAKPPAAEPDLPASTQPPMFAMPAPPEKDRLSAPLARSLLSPLPVKVPDRPADTAASDASPIIDATPDTASPDALASAPAAMELPATKHTPPEQTGRMVPAGNEPTAAGPATAKVTAVPVAATAGTISHAGDAPPSIIAGSASAVALPPAVAGALAPLEARGSASIRRLSGPVGIGSAAGDSARASTAPLAAPGIMAQSRPLPADGGAPIMVNVPFSFQIAFQNAISAHAGAAGESPAPPPTEPVPPPDATAPAGSFADISIGVDSEAGLAVRLAAADEGAVARLRGEIGDLERALAAIGSEVEVIDVALRTSAGEYGRNGQDDSQPGEEAHDRRIGPSEPEAKGWGGNAGGNTDGTAHRARQERPDTASPAGRTGTKGAAGMAGGNNRTAPDGKVDRYG